MKKIAIVMFVVAAALSGCGKKKPAAAPASDTTTAPAPADGSAAAPEAGSASDASGGSAGGGM